MDFEHIIAQLGKDMTQGQRKKHTLFPWKFVP